MLLTRHDLFFESNVLPGGEEQWWQAWWFWALLALSSTLPFWLSPLPPMGDLFNHMGRYHVMLHRQQSPLLRSYYDFRWGFVPNLGQDLLMLAVGPFLGIERGALLLSALLPPAKIWAIRSLGKAVHGKVQPTALLAVSFVYSFTFLFGFLNYETGVTVVLWALVLWFRLRNEQSWWKTPVLVAVSAVALICHIGAWIIFLLAMGALETARALNRRQWRIVPVCLDVLLATVPLLLPGLLLLVAVPGKPAPLAFSYPGLIEKLKLLQTAFRAENKYLDGLSLILVPLVAIGVIATGRARVQTGLAFYAALLGLLYLALPVSLLAGLWGDARLLPVLGIAALLAIRVNGTERLRLAIAVIGLTLFSARLAWTSEGWMMRGSNLVADLHALDRVPRGARIAELVQWDDCRSRQMQGLHTLAALAIVRRDAFVDTEWDIPGQNLLRPTYMRGTPYNAGTAVKVGPGDHCGEVTLDERLQRLPRGRFDFVWALGVEVPERAYRWLTPVFRGPNAVLYRVDRPALDHAGALAPPR